jgi:erythromycin esterase-like protein
MTAFDLEVDAGRLDFQLMLNSFVTLFWRTSVYNEAVEWLRQHGYTVVQLDAAQWATDADMHRDIASTLGFPA